MKDRSGLDAVNQSYNLGVWKNQAALNLKNDYFDEKMNGTVHLALGDGEFLGGANVSAIHWDIVKDLRFGGRIELDGKVVQENGIWVA